MSTPNICDGGNRIYGVLNTSNLEKCHVNVEWLGISLQIINKSETEKLGIFSLDLSGNSISGFI